MKNIKTPKTQIRFYLYLQSQGIDIYKIPYIWALWQLTDASIIKSIWLVEQYEKGKIEFTYKTLEKRNSRNVNKKGVSHDNKKL